MHAREQLYLFSEWNATTKDEVKAWLGSVVNERVTLYILLLLGEAFTRQTERRLSDHEAFRIHFFRSSRK